MCGGRPWLTATSSPHVRCVLCVISSPIEKIASAIAEGLKICVRRPSRRHVMKFLAEHAGGHQQELQEEPVVFEPQKQIRAEDDWKRTEAENPLIAPRPAHQHVQNVDKHNLRNNQRRVVIHLAPVPSPIQIDAGVHRELDIVNRLGDDGVAEYAPGLRRPMAHEHQQDRHRTRGCPDGAGQSRIGAHPRDQRKCGQHADQTARQRKG